MSSVSNNKATSSGNITDEDENEHTEHLQIDILRVTATQVVIRCSPVQLRSQLPTPNINPNFASTVFSMESLLERILDYAISSRNKAKRVKTLCAIRLVQKRWNDAVTKLFRKKGEPLFHLVLNKRNSLCRPSSMPENGKLLRQFVNSVHGTFQCVPTFKMKIREEFFRKENHNLLSDCLVHCGTGLVELEMTVPENGGSLPCIFPKFALPLLKKLTIHLSENKLTGLRDGEKLMDCEDNITHLIQSLLKEAPRLDKFRIPSQKKMAHAPDLEYISLPASLTKVELDCILNSEDLNMLLKSKLPELQSLGMLVPVDSGAKEMIRKIMDKFRKTLWALKLLGACYEGQSDVHHSCKFPVMESLESLYLDFRICDLGPSFCASRCLPSLQTLELNRLNDQSFSRWMKKSTFLGVRELSILFVDDSHPSDDIDNYVVSLDFEKMRILNTAFPNVCSLELFISGKEVTGLKYVFMEMRKLTCLKIGVVGNSPGIHFWDATLIGAPTKLIAALKESPEFWENVAINTNNKDPSIKNLQELETLRLEYLGAPGTRLDVNQSLISNVTFEFAFLKMPKLKELYFKGQFRASREMTEKWNGLNRKLVYKPGEMFQ